MDIESRRTRLEENISQSIALMDRLKKAETRLERVEILEKIRAINRCVGRRRSCIDIIDYAVPVLWIQA